jgi:hypothetical protein
MRWPERGSLAEHLQQAHGFDVGRTIDDATHRRDHTYHDTAVALLVADLPPPADRALARTEALAARLSWVLPVGHPYTPLA